MKTSQLYELFKEYPIATTDTRQDLKGSIFFALKGPNFNGNKYAKKALELGCKYAVVDEAEYTDGSSNIILVENTLKALQDLAHYHRSKFKIPVIAVTGTNGKTTSKELITAVLSTEFNVLATQGNFNNHIGVPLTLLKINKSHEIAVIEMGANHVGEIRFLSEIADPNYGLITNIGRAHIEGFGSFENIIQAKGELYDYLKSRSDAKIFIDHGNVYLRNLVTPDLYPIYYGSDESLFVSGSVVSMDPYLTFKWRFSQNYHTVHTHLFGEYNFTNALSAVSIGKYFGVKSSKVSKAIEDYTPTNYRSQLKKTDKNTLIVDAYNANPTSMNAALSNFMKVDVLNKVLILGDMRELGLGSMQEHQNIVDLISSYTFDDVFLIGSNFYETKSSFSTFANLDEFLDYLKMHPISDKYILIKGSRGLQLEKTIGLL